MFKKYLEPKVFLPIFLAVFPFVVYWITKPPSILWVDSGTMIAASYTLGIPNPPGFPFYMMASHLFAILPFGNVLTRLELFSIIFSILAIQLIYRIILLLINSDFFFYKPAKSDEALKIDIQPNKNLKYFAAFFGAVSLAFSYQYWSQSQNTEAFIFTDFFLVLFVYIILFLEKKRKLYFYEGNRAEITKFTDYFFKTLLLLAFLYGLASGANPTIAALIPGVLFVVYLNRRFFNIRKVIILSSVGILTAAAVYSYLPIRASAWPFVNWGNPQTLSLFIGQLRGAGLNIYEPSSGSINGFTGSPVVFLQSVSHFFYLLILQFTPFLLPFLGFGSYFAYKKNRYLFWFLLSVPIVDVFYAGLYYSGNQESWFILSWVIFSIFIGLGFYYFFLRFKIKQKYIKALLFMGFLPFLVWFAPLNRSNHYYSEDYAKNLYTSFGKNAIFIETGDFTNSLGYYLRVADKYRPDVTPITANTFYVNKWYRDNLRHSSDIIVSPKLEDIIQLKAFDEYNRAMNELIADNIDKRPIYVTPLTLRASALAATSGGQLVLDSRFKFIPNGLSLRVVPKNANIDPNLSSFDFKYKTPNPQKAPFYLERNYVYGYKNLANDYAYAWEALGDWYLNNQKYNDALNFYKKADSWSPNNPEILSRFGQYYGGALKEYDVARQYFQKAVNLQFQSPQMHFNLASAYSQLGQLDKAKQEYDIVQKLAPGQEIAQEAKNAEASLENSIPQATQQQLQPKQTQRVEKLTKTYTNKKQHYAFDYPNDWQVTENIQGIVTVSSPQNSFGILSLSLSGRQILKGDTNESFVKNGPFKMTGKLLGVRKLDLTDFDTSEIQSWGIDAESMEIALLTKADWGWEILPSQINPKNMDQFNLILHSLRPI